VYISFRSLLSLALQSQQTLWRGHHRLLAGLVAAGCTLMAVGAYAVVAVLPDPLDWAKASARWVIDEPLQAQQDVANIGESAATTSVTEQALRIYRSELLRPSDTADSLLRRLDVRDADAAAFLRNDQTVRQALYGRTGRMLRVETDDQGKLLRLQARWAIDDVGQFKRLIVERQAQSAKGPWTARTEQAPLKTSVRYGSGEIQSSLFAATDAARIPDAVAVQMAEIFSGDIDFHRSLRKSDRFSVVYEVLEADDEPLQTGRVLSAEFVNQGKAFSALWFQESAQSKGGYFSFAGESLRRAYLASPLEFSRITSGFKMRMHPILNKWIAHKGLDYAAPVGTPVRVVGDGVVSFAGVQGGFGNVVIVNHRNNDSTVYAHLSRIFVKTGQRVSQAEKIGAVGATGWATGPHLHFEFRVAGNHQDPRLLARQGETVPVSASAKPIFMARAAEQRLQLNAASSNLSARFE
jgi:murein DD-endopeptidase MepM/ murein hydrolase activator NlpD